MTDALRNETNETTIDGYRVELELWDERGEQRSSCHVSKKVGRREYTGSLELLLDSGVLEDMSDGRTHPVPQRTIDRIEEWACDSGY